ncbi:MAG TPA: hypothetical protein PLQ35_01365 [bacterium]|nr:hypothetical protein [bacterium]HQL60921.1 hypothetical protein [bacterium]
MKTECTGTLFDFQPLEKREVPASFDGGTITSDAGRLLLREVEERRGNSMRGHRKRRGCTAQCARRFDSNCSNWGLGFA